MEKASHTRKTKFSEFRNARLTLIQKNNEKGKVKTTIKNDRNVRMMPQILSSSGEGSASVQREMINYYHLYPQVDGKED